MRAAALKTLLRASRGSGGSPVRPSPALGLLYSYLWSLGSEEEPPPREMVPIIGVHLLDVVAAALGPTAQAAEIVAERGMKAARLRAILAEIGRRFGQTP